MSKKSSRKVSISHLTHDLNNILTRISNSVDLLKSKVQNEGEILSLVNNIENSVNIAAEFIEEFTLTDQEKSISKRLIYIGPLVTEITNAFKTQTKDKIKFKIEIEPNVRPLFCRYSEIYRMMMNLITNSAEAIEKQGTIYISSSNSGVPASLKNFDLFSSVSNYVAISVGDDGKGIESENIKKIFDEGFSTKDKSSKRGYGLSIVKKIVDEYNGTIEVTSNLGKGTLFKILLPAAKEIDDKYFAKTRTILIAEDEPVLRELLTDLLSSHNFSVWSSENGNNVIEKLRTDLLPDLIILDQKMPDIDGTTCIKKIREMKISVPIILATGSTTESKMDELKELKVEKILVKPYNFDQMLSVIQEVLN